MRRLFIFIVLSLISSSVWGAQSATLKGTVRDLQNATVSGAEIVLKAGEQVITKIQPELSGNFSVRLDPGRYTVEIAAPGFENIVRTVNLTPSLGPQDFLMKPSGLEVDGTPSVDDDQEMEDFLMGFARTARAQSSGDMVFDLLVGARQAETNASIDGLVLDDQQTAVVGAEVLVRSGGRTVAKAQTGPNGTFRIPLQSGSYTVEVMAAGFDKAVQNLNLTTASAPLSFLLKVP